MEVQCLFTGALRQTLRAVPPTELGFRSPRLAEAVVPRPFKATGQGRVTNLEGPVNGLLQVTAPTAGQATHLGGWTTVARYSLLPDGSAIPAGTAVFTASNGEQLVVTFSGTFDAARINFTGTYQIRGGTGRFRNATGSGVNLGRFVDPATRSFVVTFQGTISY